MKKYIFSLLLFSLGFNVIANNKEKNSNKTSDFPAYYPTFNTIGMLYNNRVGTYVLNISCYNSPTILVLPSISIEGYVGTWTAPYITTGSILNIDYTQSNHKQIYYFTPFENPTIELDLKTIILIVNRVSQPYLANPLVINDQLSICTTSVVPVLPTTDSYGAVGSWSPATISNTVAGNYVFTPDDPCGFPYTVTVIFSPIQDCQCGSFLSLESPEINTDKIYENRAISTSNNYTISGNKTIQLKAYFAYVDLLPNTFIQTQTFFEATATYNSCYQDQRPALSNLGLINNDELKNYNIYLTVAPNPTSNTIEVVLNNGVFNKIIITSTDGKTMFATRTTNSETFQVDVSTYAKGIYIVSVIDKDGHVYNQKLVKD